MIYLLIGEESLIIKEIDDIINNNTIDSNCIINYDLANDSIIKVLDELNTFNIFSTKKLVICNNISKLEDGDRLLAYLKNPSENILVLKDNTKLDERKKTTKVINERAKVIDLSKIDMRTFIKNTLKDYKIDNVTISLLISYTSNNYLRIKNELNKLMMYKLDEKEITKDDINLLVKKDLESNIFTLSDYVLAHNKKKSLEVFDELIKNNVDENNIVGLLASNYRLIYRVKSYMDEKSNEEIAKIFGIHPYRIKLAREKTYNYSYEELEDLLMKLASVDYQIKSSNIDKKMIMELFLTQI